MRLPNGFGSVHKLPGNRRKPYRVRITVGWEANQQDEKVQKYKTLGYFQTKEEGICELVKYHQDPYDTNQKELTFEEVYKLWKEDHFSKIVPSAQRVWLSAFDHSKPLYFMKFRQIKTKDLERVIKNANTGNPTKVRMKSLYNMMYRFAIKHELVEKNYALYCDVPLVINPKEKRPFSTQELSLLWENKDFPFVDMVLINIYTGLRPRELVELRIQNIDLEKRLMKGGIKTISGKNRLIPIHESIYPLIVNRFNTNHERLFQKENVKCMTYDDYRNRFIKIMKHFGMNHTPHEARHTFITLGKRYQMNEFILKKIVGHKIQDITEAIYTHRGEIELINEINKIEVIDDIRK